MPSLKDIRRRIVSIKSTQKITKAMKLVSAAKFARASQAVVAARPYSTSFDGVVQGLLNTLQDQIVSPLVEKREEKKVLLVMLSTDRGFCGSLNSNLFKSVTGFLKKKSQEGVSVTALPLGKRARLFANKAGLEQLTGQEKVLEKPNYQQAKDLSRDLAQRFLSGEFDAVYMAFVEFRSAISQSPRITALLPVAVDVEKSMASDDGSVLIEPKPQQMVDALLSRVLNIRVLKALLEGSASEHGARMTAMDSASNNASDVLRGMNIEYARARQAAITKELIEITSGAQAV